MHFKTLNSFETQTDYIKCIRYSDYSLHFSFTFTIQYSQYYINGTQQISDELSYVKYDLVPFVPRKDKYIRYIVHVFFIIRN